jgi:hypothetical protein
LAQGIWRPRFIGHAFLHEFLNTKRRYARLPLCLFADANDPETSYNQILSATLPHAYLKIIEIHLILDNNLIRDFYLLKKYLWKIATTIPAVVFCHLGEIIIRFLQFLWK